MNSSYLVLSANNAQVLETLGHQCSGLNAYSTEMRGGAHRTVLCCGDISKLHFSASVLQSLGFSLRGLLESLRLWLTVRILRGTYYAVVLAGSHHNISFAGFQDILVAFLYEDMLHLVLVYTCVRSCRNDSHKQDSNNPDSANEEARGISSRGRISFEAKSHVQHNLLTIRHTITPNRRSLATGSSFYKLYTSTPVFPQYATSGESGATRYSTYRAGLARRD